MAVISASTKGLMTSSKMPYRDILLGSNTTAPSMDPRLLAREGIKAQQVLIDFPVDSGIR